MKSVSFFNHKTRLHLTSDVKQIPQLCSKVEHLLAWWWHPGYHNASNICSSRLILWHFQLCSFLFSNYLISFAQFGVLHCVNFYFFYLECHHLANKLYEDLTEQIFCCLKNNCGGFLLPFTFYVMFQYLFYFILFCLSFILTLFLMCVCYTCRFELGFQAASAGFKHECAPTPSIHIHTPGHDLQTSESHYHTSMFPI